MSNPAAAIATLTLRESTGLSRQHDPLISGVPLARGVLPAGRELALRNEQGQRLNTQTDVLARWADGSAKWALLTVPALAVAAGQPVRLALEPCARQDRQGIVLERTDAGVSVDTGRLHFTLGRRGPLVERFEVLQGGQWQARAADLDLVMKVQREGAVTTYRAAADEGRQVEVEAAGPYRAVLAVRGTHRAEDGRTFGPYTLRLEVLADQPQVRLTHSFIYDGDPDRDFVRASLVTLRAEVGEQRQFGFGGDGGREVRFERQRADWAADYRYAELFQAGPTCWEVRRWVDLERRGIFADQGLHADGWMELSGTAGRVAVAVREMWQQHPKSLFADAAAGELRIGLYPERAEPLNLRRYSAWAYTRCYEHPAFKTEQPVPADPALGAHGIRKTHDLALFFDHPNPSLAALHYNHPLRLMATPTYLASTGVLIPAAPRPRGLWLDRLTGFLQLLQVALHRDGATGYLDYFDLPMGYNEVEGRWTYDYGGHGYINDEAMPCLGMWQAYFLTGRDDAFALARAMTRHNADIDCYHLGPLAGLGSRHNVNHWGDTCKEPRIAQPVGKRFLYYQTGDRSILDLGRVCLEALLRQAEPRAVDLHATAPAYVSTLLFAAEAGLADVDDWLVRIADAIAASVDEAGRMAAALEFDVPGRSARASAAEGRQGPLLNFMMFSCFGGPQTFAELAERYDHQPLRQALVRLARFQMLPVEERQAFEGEKAVVMKPLLGAFRAADLLAYAYQQTRDPAFAQPLQPLQQFMRVVVREQPEPRYGQPAGGQRLVPHLVDWPDTTPEEIERARGYRPIPHAATSHFFEMAVYLHKMQAFMLLAGAGQGESDSATVESPHA